MKAVLVVGTLGWAVSSKFDDTLGILVVIIGILVLALLGPTPEPGPKQPKTHHWVPVIGIGAGPWGILPFVTITRRPRR